MSEGDLMAQAETDVSTPKSYVQSVLKWSMGAPVVEFDMPADARVIDVRTQENMPTLWTLGTENGQTRRRTFVGFGTGHPIMEPNLEYVGSAHGVDGWMVFHIFERAGEGHG